MRISFRHGPDLLALPGHRPVPPLLHLLRLSSVFSHRPPRTWSVQMHAWVHVCVCVCMCVCVCTVTSHTSPQKSDSLTCKCGCAHARACVLSVLLHTWACMCACAWLCFLTHSLFTIAAVLIKPISQSSYKSNRIIEVYVHAWANHAMCMKEIMWPSCMDFFVFSIMHTLSPKRISMASRSMVGGCIFPSPVNSRVWIWLSSASKNATRIHHASKDSKLRKSTCTCIQRWDNRWKI